MATVGYEGACKCYARAMLHLSIVWCETRVYTPAHLLTVVPQLKLIKYIGILINASCSFDQAYEYVSI